MPAPAGEIAPLGDWLARGEVDASRSPRPRRCRAVVDAPSASGRPSSEGVLLAAIGPTTADALREHGFEPGAQPERYTGVDLAEAVAAQLGPG